MKVLHNLDGERKEHVSESCGDHDVKSKENKSGVTDKLFWDAT
jgi:hypothetical protein